jgi:hypothetical protein
MKFITVSLLVLVALSAAAQNPPVERAPFLQLAHYLSLTPPQIADLLRINLDLQRFLSEKQRRVGAVRRELVEETRRPVVDPMALGLRYMELEAICRESREREVAANRAARALLLPPQAQRLAALEQALALLPVAVEAAAANLLGDASGGITLSMPGRRPLPGCTAPALPIAAAVLPRNVTEEPAEAP